MKTKLILLSLLLGACSTVQFLDSKSKNKVSVDNRQSNSSSNIKKQDANVNAIENPIIETVKNDNSNGRKDPNTIFSDYSVYFDLDEYTVQEKYKPLLKQHAEFLIKNSNEKLFIEGHTDERGGAEYNLSLGQKRANAVRKELLLNGVKDAQLEAYSYGSEKPKALGSNEAAWAQNRRVDLYYEN